MFIPYQDLDFSIGSRDQQQHKRGGVKYLLYFFLVAISRDADPDPAF
jgi:hypothetical protein